MVTSALPARYDTRVHHARQSPFRHTFSYRSNSWLVDLDRLPRKGFRAEDHVGDPSHSLRENVDALLASRGIRAARVLMLANRRALGHVFNPLSVFWALDDSEQVVATVAEVHNTYGGKHAYVLPAGTTTVPKAFYVSPFHEVEGHYALRLPLPDDEVKLDIVYHREGAKPFSASVRGRRAKRPRPTPFATRLVSLRIRLHGIRLWLRGLPVIPRQKELL